MTEKKYSANELNGIDKNELVKIVMALQEEKADLQKENNCLQNDLMLSKDEIAILKNKLFGRKSEKDLDTDGEQLVMTEFNEVESVAEAEEAVEPELTETIVYTRKKKTGKREEDLAGLPVTIVEHTMTEEELKDAFGEESYTRLPDTIYRKLEVVPAQYHVYEHHLAVYKCSKTGKIVKTPHPAEMLNNSIATPSIVAAIMNAKYTNALPLYRIEKEFESSQVHIKRQNMAHWVIQCSELYLSLLYKRMHTILCKENVVQCDETPVLVKNDGRPAGSKSYMWVYRTGEFQKDTPIVLYDYEKTRNSEHPQEFLKDFSGVAVCDGFSGYTTLEKKKENFQVANCYAHARRPFADIVKAQKETGAGHSSTAKKAVKMLANIFTADGNLKELSAEERQARRCEEVKPLVEAYFAWAKKAYPNVPPESKIGKALAYSIAREDSLKVFLTNGNIPLDNSASERSIRPFTIGRKNFVMIDTVHGAKASAEIYSIVETAKANHLNIYEYLKCILTEFPKFIHQNDLSFVDDFLPWSDKLPDSCRK